MAVKSVFLDRYGLTVRDIEAYLSAALDRGGDYADLFFELRINHSISLEEQLVKTATKAINLGVGVRVLAGDKTGYAYSENLDQQEVMKAARTAAFIASSSSNGGKIGLSAPSVPQHDLYSISVMPAELAIADKIVLLEHADVAARSYDSRIRQVQASYVDETRHILLASSDGRYVCDVQPMVRMNVACVAEENGNRQGGHQGAGGRRTLEIFKEALDPRSLAREAARQAVLLLGAREAPAGSMEVVLGPGWPGILLHEAIGHGLEADFNRKKTSAFSGLVGQKVASELCTVIDDGTIPFRRGSLNVDDEGTQTRETVVIEKGVLTGYLQDRLSSTLMGVPMTGNGRREGYSHIPIPRMTNTFMMSGQSSPEDVIRSVKKGLYATHFGGGQVDITSGKFVFTASEAWLIEDGKITSPVKGASLIGDGPTVLKKVSMVANDLRLDQGVGVCTKEGQHIPVGVGLPTVKIDEITVGGTQRW